MFPRLRQTFSTALVDRIDDIVEFSTLGEYVLAEDLRPIAVGSGSAGCDGSRDRVSGPSGRRVRGDCPVPDWAWPSPCSD